MEPGDGLQDRPERSRCEADDCRDRNQEQDREDDGDDAGVTSRSS